MKKNNSLKNKNTIGFGLIYVILLGVFNLLVFTVFKNHSSVFWISYTFMTLAFAVQIISMFLSFKTADVETAFFGIPLASFSVYYLCAELVIGAIFMIFRQAGFTLALVIQAVVLAIFLVVAIVSLMARDTVREIGNNIKEKVADLRSVLIDVEMMRDGCSDPELKEKLRKLSETVKYSDPISNAAVADVEQRINRQVSELRAYLDNNQLADAAQACKELELLYAERNKKLAMSK